MTYPVAVRPGSWWDALYVTIVGNRGEPSGESRLVTIPRPKSKRHPVAWSNPKTGCLHLLLPDLPRTIARQAGLSHPHRSQQAVVLDDVDGVRSLDGCPVKEFSYYYCRHVAGGNICQFYRYEVADQVVEGIRHA